MTSSAQTFPSLEWKPELMERNVIEQLLQTQFEQYLHRVKQTDSAVRPN